MKKTILAVCALAGTALAQPADPPPPVEQPTAPVEQPPQPPPPPQPPLRVVEPPAAAPEEVPALVRPVGFSLAIGLGYRLPTSLTTPNITSVRFRFAGGVTLEPTLVLASTQHVVDNGEAQTRAASEVGAAALLRFPVMSKKRTDVEILGGLGFDYLGEDPDDDNTDDVTTTTTISGRYGVAIGYWISPHLQVSMSATNSLFSFAKKREEMGIGSVLVTNDLSFGLIFDPTVAFMIHLYN